MSRMPGDGGTPDWGDMEPVAQEIARRLHATESMHAHDAQRDVTDCRYCKRRAEYAYAIATAEDHVGSPRLCGAPFESGIVSGRCALGRWHKGNTHEFTHQGLEIRWADKQAPAGAGRQV